MQKRAIRRRTEAASLARIGAEVRQRRVPSALLAGYVVLWLSLAIAPFDRSTWFLEHLPALALVTALVATRRSLPLSDLSYALVALFLVLHAVGAHYTYGRVPLGEWMSDAFGFGRNHFDRLMHAAFGLLFAVPIREVLVRLIGGGQGRLADLLAFVIVLASGAVHEIAEWVIAETVNPAVGEAYLGAQGDFWDAQKDMSVAALGAGLGLAIAAALRRDGAHETRGPDGGGASGPVQGVSAQR